MKRRRDNITQWGYGLFRIVFLTNVCAIYNGCVRILYVSPHPIMPHCRIHALIHIFCLYTHYAIVRIKINILA